MKECKCCHEKICEDPNIGPDEIHARNESVKYGTILTWCEGLK